MYTYKVELILNNKQETRIRDTLNKCIECQNIIYDKLDYLLKHHRRLPSSYDLRKEFTRIKKEEDLKLESRRKGLSRKEQRKLHLGVLFYDVSNEALKQTVKDTHEAFMKYLTHVSNYPRRKKFNDYHKSFYIDPCKILFTSSKVKLEKISLRTDPNRQVLNWIKLAEKNRIPINVKYYNPRVVMEGEKFYLNISVDDINGPSDKKELSLTNKVIGIDINVNAIVTSEGKFYYSINDSKEIKDLERQKKVLTKSLNRKLIVANESGKELKDAKNYLKTRKEINKITNRIKHLREQHHSEIISDIIKGRPKVIGIESLAIKEMIKLKEATSGMQRSGFGKFINSLKSRAKKYGIQIIEVDQYYPSSKMCSRCKAKKAKLALSERIYKCEHCGLEIDRDLNAAINIRNYCLKELKK